MSQADKEFPYRGLAGLLKSSEDEVLSEYLKNRLAKVVAPASGISGAPSEAVKLSPDQKKQLLLSAFEKLQQRYEFKVGDFVRWKEGLRNRIYPEAGDPAIVCEVLNHPIMDATSDSGDYTFREELNLKLGVMGPEGSLVIWHYDSARFEPYPDK